MSKIWEQIRNNAPSPNLGDEAFMAAALNVARRGLGQVWPNPAVGCLLVKNGQIIARGWTQPGGRPHAEAVALERAGDHARGSTAYVTLEPCSHVGQTPPCAHSLIEAGVSRVVVAITDPDPRVSGAGIQMLRDAGIDVTTGILEQEAFELNEGFFLKVTENRPLFTLKAATTLDSKIAVHTGESQWITGQDSRKFGHYLRANHDAIMVGIGTASEDNPQLSCRLPGLSDRSPVRIVIDRRMRLPLTSHLVQSASTIPTWLISLGITDEIRAEAYEAAGVELITAPSDNGGGITLNWVAEELANRGLTRVLVEGGSHLAAAMLRRDLIDRLCWMRNPRLIGHDGIPMTQAFGIDRLDDAPIFERSSIRENGPDLLETYRRNRKSDQTKP